jgi:hypothetical protein
MYNYMPYVCIINYRVWLLAKTLGDEEFAFIDVYSKTWNLLLLGVSMRGPLVTGVIPVSDDLVVEIRLIAEERE